MSSQNEGFRMDVVSRARNFKRSWVEMAEVLVKVRKDGIFRKWGYESIHGYAVEELNIKRATVDKLTGSFHAMQRHVPHVLEWDGVAQPIPDYEAVDYFAKAVEPPLKDGERVRDPATPDVVEELKQAIFDEQASPPALRRRFNTVLNPKTEAEDRQALLQRVRASARRLNTLVCEVDGLSEDRVSEVSDTLDALQRDVEGLL